MAPTLGGSTAGTAVAAAGTSPRGNAPRGKDGADGFDRMLQQADSPSRPPRSQQNANADTPSDTTATRKDRPSSAQDGGTREPSPDEVADTEAAVSPAAQPDGVEHRDDVPEWPPAGLAGLLLSMPPAATEASAALTSPSTSTAAMTSPAMASPALPIAAAAPSAGFAVAVDAEAGDAELPADLMDALMASGGTDEAAASDDTATTPGLLFGLSSLQAMRTGSEPAVARMSDPNPTPVLGQDGFDDAVSAKVGWLAEQKIGHAHIRISPDDMGAIDVRLQMDGDKVHASFSSPHVEVRHALESSLPRLRELLGEQGFQLAHADVGHQPQGEPGQGEQRSNVTGEGREAERGIAEVTLSSAQLIRQRGLLDVHA
ncbi:flagellar hook-length control protein FliK [Stenotrophomonas sp. WHRI 8082]|uniref:flagellar hook-length control protein FliK n=1 Tax=Stenotrophomonas sp. WHRI 8082 TaxID=3162571 RepID=UPI0032EB1B5C